MTAWTAIQGASEHAAPTTAHAAATTGRGRGRPARDAGIALSRGLIARKALDIAGSEGFPALTMHRLARALDVTPRALYNHVRDRQDVVDAVAALMMQEIPVPHLDPAHWRDSLRAAYREARDAYRRFPRALLIVLDETLTPAGVDPNRVVLAERMLGFFVDIGLSLPQAVAARNAFLIDTFGFALTVDYRYDRGEAAARDAVVQPVPALWLESLPDVPAPLSRRAAALPPPTSDAVFDAFVDMRIAAIGCMVEARR